MQIDWSGIFLNDFGWSYAAEIVVRTLVMFVFILLLLRLSGKRGVRQLSLFEVAIIISFGSAAGDPMFNKDLAIIPCIIVLVVIVALYRFITWLTVKSEKIESILEGDPVYIIEDGQYVLSDDSGHPFAQDEFLSEMRQQSVEHLGQVRVAILETNGMISFIYYEDEEVKYGMPVLPKACLPMSENISVLGQYACTYCGHVAQLEAKAHCTRCKQQSWVKAINTRRIG